MKKSFISFFRQSKIKRKSILVENNEIISDNAEIAKIFKNYLDTVGNLDINQILECVREFLKEDPVLASIENWATCSSNKLIKSGINCITSNSSFEYVDQDQVFQEIKKLDGNKASSKNDIPIKRMKKKPLISSLIFYTVTLLTPYLTLSFQVN